jgi:hypothetical protein
MFELKEEVVAESNKTLGCLKAPMKAAKVWGRRCKFDQDSIALEAWVVEDTDGNRHQINTYRKVTDDVTKAWVGEKAKPNKFRADNDMARYQAVPTGSKLPPVIEWGESAE